MVTRFSFACVLMLAGVANARAEQPADASSTPLVAHHATYRLTLVKSTGRKAPEAVDGLLSYDFSGSACDGYATTLRQMTAFQPQEGETRVSDMQTASFEDADARDFRFKVATKGDGTEAATVDGSAHRGADDVVSVKIDRPQAEKIELPSGVLFPTEHLKRIIATAKAGGKILSATVYDGSETGKKVFSTLGVIGPRIVAEPTGTAIQPEALRGVARWPVTISYFDAGKTDTAPEYVLTFELYENGVSRALRLDYGDFVLAGDLTELATKPATACGR